MKLILLLIIHGGAHASLRHKATKNAVDAETTQRLAVAGPPAEFALVDTKSGPPSQQAGAPPTSPSTATTTRDAPRTSPSTVRNLEEFNDHLRLNVARAVNAEKTERA